MKKLRMGCSARTDLNLLTVWLKEFRWNRKRMMKSMNKMHFMTIIGNSKTVLKRVAIKQAGRCTTR